MDCPVCKTTRLVMSERQGIEIDYCPNCRGVWLDRGELDKIIERSETAAAPQRDQAPPPYAGQPHQQPQGYPRQSQGYPPSQQGYPNQQQGYYKKKKREGFLGDLFDF